MGGETKKKKLIRSNLFLTLLEMFQLSITLFLVALLVSFILSNIFNLLDKEMKKAKENNEISKNAYTTLKAIEVFFQLFIVVVAYYYIEEFLYKIPSIAGVIKDAYNSFKTARHAIHLIMIVILIEFNSSLQYNIHEVGDGLIV